MPLDELGVLYTPIVAVAVVRQQRNIARRRLRDSWVHYHVTDLMQNLQLPTFSIAPSASSARTAYEFEEALPTPQRKSEHAFCSERISLASLTAVAIAR
jgi:hypothetical protein